MQQQSFWIRTFSHLNAILLGLVVVAVLVLPALGVQYNHYLYPPVFTAIFLVSAFIFSKSRKPVLAVAIGLIVLLWISILFAWETLEVMVRCLQFIFFFLLVLGLIKQISSAPKVTSKELVNAITGYLLLGFTFSLVVTVLHFFIADAYSVVANAESDVMDMMSMSIYYTFITFSTTGYGDILPVHPWAKSLAIIIGISGQLYIAIIIAMLVGKYASSKTD
jgi:hypothetical protein